MSGTFKSKKNNIIVKKKKPKIEDEKFQLRKDRKNWNLVENTNVCCCLLISQF